MPQNPAVVRPWDVFLATLQKADLPDRKNPGQVRQEPGLRMVQASVSNFRENFL